VQALTTAGKRLDYSAGAYVFLLASIDHRLGLGTERDEAGNLGVNLPKVGASEFVSVGARLLGMRSKGE